MADNAAVFEQVEHADNILFYIDDNQIIFTDYTQGDNEVDLLVLTFYLAYFFLNYDFNERTSSNYKRIPSTRGNNNCTNLMCLNSVDFKFMNNWFDV